MTRFNSLRTLHERVAAATGWRAALVPAACLALFLVNALIATACNTGVCDELGAHIPAGYLYASTGEFGTAEDFPLGQALIALPVCLAGLDYELFTEQHLALFRLPIVLLGVLTGVVVYRFATELFGRAAGLAAVFLYSLSPNVLAHSTVATLDLATACFVFWTFHRLYRAVVAPGPLAMVWLGLALGLALATKVQAIALLPLVGLVLVAFAKPALVASGRPPLRFFATWLLIAAGPLVVINLAYLHLPGPGGILPPSYVEALTAKFEHASRGHFAYLMGEYSQEGWLHYFPVAIALKTPLPALALLAVGLLGRHGRLAAAVVLLPIAAFLGAAMYSRVNIGLRHVLMIYPFVFVVAGLGAAKWWRRGGWRGIAVVGLLLVHAAEAAWIAPRHLSYFNALAGGPSGGHRYLIDSNYDWGQNDDVLRRYVASSSKPYRIDPDPFAPTTGPILVNANALYGVINGGPAAYEWLEPHAPVNRIAYTWFEYDVPGADGGGSPRAPAEDLLRSWLLALRERHADVDDRGYLSTLARALSAVRGRQAALDVLRSILARYPTDTGALMQGGEIVVRHKLGVLRFEGTEYLDGVAPTPARGDVDPGQLARAAASIGLHEMLAQLCIDLGAALNERGDAARAVRAFRDGLALHPENYAAYSLLAWLLATSPDPGLRDGATAVRLAEKMNELTGGASPEVLDVLAAAYAEVGRFDAAVATARRALQGGLQSGQPGWAEEVRARLRGYEARRPFRGR